MWRWLSYMEYLRKGRDIYGLPKEDECLLLEKMIYGLVQSARKNYKKFTAVLLVEGFIQSAADPCLYV
jgi:hypothetical protein